MGICPASFHVAFESREGLFREALRRYRSGVGSGLPRILDTAPTAREAISLLLEGTASTVTRRLQPRGCMIVLGALHGFTEATALAAELQCCRKKDMDAISARLKRAVADGELPSSCEVAKLSAFYMAIPARHFGPGKGRRIPRQAYGACQTCHERLARAGFERLTLHGLQGSISRLHDCNTLVRDYKLSHALLDASSRSRPRPRRPLPAQDAEQFGHVFG